ncbi:MAG: hypothetical protein IJW08_10375 [Lentisphaeria bacterium]|nr:hypothetical protein [Lentisphaeria bacterium]MBQ7396932.1 hypothetical protein [Lentisphaeria bacterium]
MKNWKRNGKTFLEIILQDLGDDPAKWSEYFEKDGIDAFNNAESGIFIRIPKINVLINLYNQVKDKQGCNTEKKKKLKEAILAKSKNAIDEERDAVSNFLTVDELETLDWYYTAECTKYFRKLNLWTLICVLPLIVAANILNFVWNGWNYTSTSSIVLYALSVLTLLVVECDIYIQSRMLRGKIWPAMIIAIGTAGFLGGIFSIPDSELWATLIIVWLLVSFFICLKMKSKTPSLANLSRYSWRAVLFSVPALAALTVSAIINSSPGMADNLELANVSHSWNWHNREKCFREAWRNEPDGLYKKLNDDLRKPEIWNPINEKKIDEAYSNFEKYDPELTCGKKRMTPPWKGVFKKWLEEKCKTTINGAKNENTCSLVCDYMRYYRGKFHAHPVKAEFVFEKLFKGEIAKYDGEKLAAILNLMDEFVKANENSAHLARTKAIIPALENILAQIEKNVELPHNELHVKFKNLESKCQTYGSNEEQVFKDYKKASAERDRIISDKVKSAAEKYVVKNDYSAWRQCESILIEEFCYRIPVVCYVLWKYGHPNINDGAHKDNRWLRYLENDRAGIPADSNYYAAEIHRQMQNNTKAIQYYKQSLASDTKNYSRQINMRHIIVNLTNDAAEKWTQLWELYEANSLLDSELLTFARMCVNHNKDSVALDIYNRCKTSTLETSDLFKIVELNQNKHAKNVAFEKLSGRLEHNMNSGNIDNKTLKAFFDLGIKNGDLRTTYNLIHKAVVKGNKYADELYVKISKQHGKLDSDAVAKLISNEKVDKEVIKLAEFLNEKDIYILEAKRWEKQKYAGYNNHLIKAGEIAYKDGRLNEAWDLWHRLDYQDIDKIKSSYLAIIRRHNISNLDAKDLQYLVKHNIEVKNIQALINFAEYFENKKGYMYSVFFWEKVCKLSPDKKVRGYAYYKLYDNTDGNKKTEMQTTSYPLFDKAATDCYLEMSKLEKRKSNLYTAAFEYHNKQAVLFLGNLWYTQSYEAFYPKGREDELKNIIGEVLKKDSSLTPKEKLDMQTYHSTTADTDDAL